MIVLFFYNLIINCNNIVWFDFKNDKEVDIYLSLREEALDSKTNIFYNVDNSTFSEDSNLTSELRGRLGAEVPIPFKTLDFQETKDVFKKVERFPERSLFESGCKLIFINNKNILKATIGVNSDKEYSVEKVISYDDKEEYVRERYFFDFKDNNVFFYLNDKKGFVKKRILTCKKENGLPNERISFDEVLSKKNYYDLIERNKVEFENFHKLLDRLIPVKTGSLMEDCEYAYNLTMGMKKFFAAMFDANTPNEDLSYSFTTCDTKESNN